MAEKIYNIKSIKEQEDIISDLLNKGLEGYQIIGNLKDNWIFENYLNIKVKGMTPKYILMIERFINTWTSTVDLILTDDREKFDYYYNLYEKQEI